MGLAKGRQEGFGYKEDALALKPGLVCRRERAICDIVGFVVYDGKKAISSASNAHEAWFKAYSYFKRRKKGN